jgi:hypothetical protein
LDIDGFEIAEVEESFKPITIDPGRNEVFVAYDGEGEFRSMSTKEYYSFNGAVFRQKQRQKQNTTNGIAPIESTIPTNETKSTRD